MKQNDVASESNAFQLDRDDPLAACRERFLIPRDAAGEPRIHLAGNSLGLQPVSVRAAVERELDDWARLAVDAHFEGRTPWYSYHQALREPVLEAVQTNPDEFGYGFSTWSVARLTEHIRRRRRLRASPSTVRRVLAHERFSLQRPKHTLEGKRDEKAHATAKKELAGLKKKRFAKTQPKRSSSRTKPKSTSIRS